MAPPRRKQSGLILLLLVGVLGLGATYMMLRAFNVAAELNTSRQLKNALILEEAKAALLMYVSAQVATESYPGKLPCPEDTSKIGTANEGRTKTYCSLPAVGRLPWKTLEYASAPLDLDGEQLWYAVSPGFNRAGVGTTLKINSDTTAGLTVDDSPARAVALIFSPGRSLSGQTRSAVTITSPPAAANYLDLENATLDINFATHGPAGGVSTTFNDQVSIISHQDLFNVVEPAVAKRISDTLVTGIKPLTPIYTTSSWGGTWPTWSEGNTYSGVTTYALGVRVRVVSGGVSTVYESLQASNNGHTPATSPTWWVETTPIFVYPAPFGDPDTSTFQGASGISQGLLPVTFSTTPGNAAQYCNSATDGPRCDPAFVKWISFQSIAKQNSGGMTLYASPAPNCMVADSQLSCTIYTDNTGSLTINVVATASNVAMALRQLDADAPSISEFNSVGRTVSATFNSDGSSRITFQGRVVSSGALGSYGCTGSPCYQRTFSIPIRVFADHPIVNSSDPDYGWFTKNDWHKLTYYAIAPGFAASGARSCTAPNCLTITNLSTTPTDNKRAILILAGRPITVQTRPSGTLSNYLESENLSPIDSIFVTLKPSLVFNDRVIVVDSN